MRRFAHGASSCGGNSGASRREDIASVGPDILPRPEKAVRRGGTATRGGAGPGPRGAGPGSGGGGGRVGGGQGPARGGFRGFRPFLGGGLRRSGAESARAPA